MSAPESLTASASSQSSWTVSTPIGGLSSNISASGDSYGQQQTWELGDGEGEINAVYFDYGAIPGGGTATFDLFNVDSPQSNLEQSFAFSLVKYIKIELLPNPDGSSSASSISIGNAATNAFQGWISAGATVSIDGGINSVPYQAGSDTGKAVSATVRNLKIVNNDASNYATVRLTVYGLQTNP
jgi:hypothetical protein